MWHSLLGTNWIESKLGQYDFILTNYINNDSIHPVVQETRMLTFLSGGHSIIHNIYKY